jgi:serine/threonine protein phosphatase PrpC
MTLDVAGLSDQGSRDHNEDNWGSPAPNLTPEQIAAKGLLYVVADGVGGHQAGEVASQIAIQTLQELYYADPNPDVGGSLQAAIEEANRRIYHQAISNSQQYGMGTTVTATVLRGQELTVANVGDSRVYLIRNGQITQLTRDHTWVAEAQASGLLTPEEARTHPQRNVITRSLGTKLEVQVDIFPPQLIGAGDTLLLCSDGLNEVVSDQEMAAIVGQGGNAAHAVHRLVELTKSRGAPDNVTAVVVGLGRRRAARPVSDRGAPLPMLIALLGLAAFVTALVVTAVRFFGPASSPPASPSPTTVTPLPVTPSPTTTLTLTPSPTATLTLTPTLASPQPERPLQHLAPDDGERILVGTEVTLRWAWRDLQPGEQFRVELKRDGEMVRLPKGVVTQTTTLSTTHGVVTHTAELLLPRLQPGSYTWWVMVEEEIEGEWEMVTRTRAGWSFIIAPPTPTPTDTPIPPTNTPTPSPPTDTPPPNGAPAPAVSPPPQKTKTP